MERAGGAAGAKEGKKNGDGKGRRRVEERATAKEGGENHDGDKARRRAGDQKRRRRPVRKVVCEYSAGCDGRGK